MKWLVFSLRLGAQGIETIAEILRAPKWRKG
jgi:hypothetical protein